MESGIRSETEIRVSAAPAVEFFAPDFQQNLYETYRWLRDEHPLYRDEQRDCWVVTRDADVRRLMIDVKRLSNSDTWQDLLRQFQSTDPPVHDKIRKVVQGRFSPKAVAALEPEVRRIAGELFDAVEPRGECDLLREVIQDFPHRVVAPFVGFPEEHRQRLYEITDPLLGWDPAGPPQPPPDYTDDMAELIDAMLEVKRRHPGDDVLSAVVQAEGPGGLTREESAYIARGLGFAAFDTTVNLLANGAAALGAHPEERAKLAADASLIPNAIDEMLRYDAPTQNQPRIVREAIEVQGVTIAPGEQVLLVIGSANRDERKWDHPDRFDVTRRCREHLAFGQGLHLCLGQHVARLEGKVFFEELLRRMPHYEVGETVHYVSAWARALYTLPIRW